MALSTEINRVKFISEDFQTYRDEANLFFQTNYPTEFNNLIATDIGNALMDQIAFAMQSLSFMVNRRSSELFLSTARLTSSITKLSRMLGYPIQPAAPSSGTVSITLIKGPYVFPVTIPIGFQFKGPGNIIYEYQGAVDYIVSPGLTTASITIKEGQTKSLSFVSDGSTNQQFNILGIPSTNYIYSDLLMLTVDGTPWTRENLIQYVSENIYEILFTENPPKLRFGDGIAGNISPVSSQISLTYRYGKGASGAIGQNQITAVVKPLVIGGISIPMTFVNNPTSVGSDPEDIRHVRSFASSFFRTQNAAVVKQDYDTIAALQSGVALADSQIMRGIDSDLTIQEDLALIELGESVFFEAVTGMASAGVSGQGFLGVSGTIYVGGVSGLGVSGLSNLGIYQGTPATGYFLFTSAGVSGDFFEINGVTFSAVNSGAGSNQYNVGATAAVTASNAASAINASTNTLVSTQVLAAPSGAQAIITSQIFDVYGNAVTLATGQPSILISGARLVGGLAPSPSGVSGMSFLGVSGVGGLFIGGQETQGVSGLDFLGVYGQDQLISTALSGIAIIDSATSGLSDYLSQAFSDTSKSNQCQVVILSTDANNKYISPSSTVLQNVQSTLRSLADAVVTVVAVDGSSELVNADITIEIGISQTAVVSDVKQFSMLALTSSVVPLGLLVKRNAGVSLYVSDIENAVRDANASSDIRFINVTIDSPSGLLDAAGNLIIGKQQIIQNGNIFVNIKQRFLTNGDIAIIA